MLTTAQIDEVVQRALAEDAPWGDITSETLVPAAARAGAVLVAREPGIMAGGKIFEATFRAIDTWTPTELLVEDGQPFETGDVLAGVEGNARTILRGERVALNLVQHLCGIATVTQAFVAAITGTQAKVVDTRKTSPGLRAIEKYAVQCGGGQNHRFSLSDAVMVKDNHLATLGEHGLDVTKALHEMKAALPHTVHIEVEVDRIDQIESVLAAGIDSILLDNFTVGQLREAVTLINGRATIEASGGVTLKTVRAIAETGVDVISVGSITQSARALDLGLDWVEQH